MNWKEVDDLLREQDLPAVADAVKKLLELRKAVKPIVEKGGVGYIEDNVFYKLKKAYEETE